MTWKGWQLAGALGAIVGVVLAVSDVWFGTILMLLGLLAFAAARIGAWWFSRG